MPRSKIALAAVAMALAISAGCGSKTASDQSIVTDIQAKLYGDAITKPASIAVAAQNGVVTLSGDVPNSDVALEAMRIANGTTGVRGVNDKMTINGASAAAQLPNGGNPAPGSTSPTSYPPVASTPTSNPESTQTAAQTPPVTQTPPQTAQATAPPAQTATAAAPAAQQAPQKPSAPLRPVMVTFPVGTTVSVRTIDAIDSKTGAAGQSFRGSLYAPLTEGNRVIIPAGAPVTLVVSAAKSAGRIKGSSELEVRAAGIEHHGKEYNIDSSGYAETGKGRGKQTGVRTGIGAAAGALIGGLAGGGKGAGIGAAVGGGAGFGSAALTHGQQVKIPSETILTFKLAAPLTVAR